MHNQYRFGQYTLTCLRLCASKDFGAYFQTDRLTKDTLKSWGWCVLSIVHRYTHTVKSYAIYTDKLETVCNVSRMGGSFTNSVYLASQYQNHC